MPYQPSDFTQSDTEAAAARAVLTAWDARDPWAADPCHDELAITRALVAACAPRLVMLPTPACAAKFLREIVALAN